MGLSVVSMRDDEEWDGPSVMSLIGMPVSLVKLRLLLGEDVVKETVVDEGEVYNVFVYKALRFPPCVKAPTLVN